MKNSKNPSRAIQMLMVSIIVLTTAGFICSAAMKGERDEAFKTCAQLYPATSTHNAAFSDPIDGGTCWACPKGAKRSAASVKAANACIKFTKAKNTGKYGCKAKYGANAFPDLGACWTCPSGYTRTAESVTSGRACAKDLIFGPFSKATKRGGSGCDSGKKDPINGGTCWTCPKGKRTVHAVNGGKACEVNLRAVRKGKAPDQIQELSGDIQRKVEQVTRQISADYGQPIGELKKLIDKLNSPKYRSYFRPGGTFAKDLQAKRYESIRFRLKEDLAPHLVMLNRYVKLPYLSIGMFAEGGTNVGVSVEEGFYIRLDKLSEYGGYVKYGAQISSSQGVSSGLLLSLSNDEGLCGAGFAINGTIGNLEGGIALDPKLSCQNLEETLRPETITGFTISSSISLGGAPLEVKANFTSGVQFKVQNGRVVNACGPCGGKDQRPCGVTERFPSCDPGLSENCGVCS